MSTTTTNLQKALDESAANGPQKKEFRPTEEQKKRWAKDPVSPAQKEILEKGKYTEQEIAALGNFLAASEEVSKVKAKWEARKAQLVTVDQIRVLMEEGVSRETAEKQTHGEYNSFLQTMKKRRAAKAAERAAAKAEAETEVTEVTEDSDFEDDTPLDSL